MWSARRGLAALAVIVVLIAASMAAWRYLHNVGRTPGCTVTATAEAASGAQ